MAHVINRQCDIFQEGVLCSTWFTAQLISCCSALWKSPSLLHNSTKLYLCLKQQVCLLKEIKINLWRHKLRRYHVHFTYRNFDCIWWHNITSWNCFLLKAKHYILEYIFTVEITMVIMAYKSKEPKSTLLINLLINRKLILHCFGKHL